MNEDSRGRIQQQSDVKPVVLTLANCYFPGFRGGGPARTIAALVDKLSDDFSLKVVAPDRDRGMDDRYPGVCSGEWQHTAWGEVFYLPGNSRASLMQALLSVLRGATYDVLYLNSFFHPTFTLAPLLARRAALAPRVPVLVAPRGELSDGALSVKRLRKAMFLRTATQLFSGVSFHASNDAEADEVRRILPDAPVFVACDLAPVVDVADANVGKRPGRARLAFISRIVPKKNLDYAVRALAGVRSAVELDVFGPIEDRVHFREVTDAIAQLPSNVRVRWVSELTPEQVPQTFARYDAFLFPTRGENFGHVIAEALLAGCPAILSDRTPWRGLAAASAGWDLSLDSPAAFTAAVETVAGWNQAARRTAGDHARTFAHAFLDSDEHLAANRAMFGRVAASARNE